MSGKLPDDLEPLSDDLRDFLDAERDIDALGADTRERLASHLAPLFVVPVGGGPGATPSMEPASTAASGTQAAASGTASAASTGAAAGLGAKLAIPLLCTALGAVGGAAGHAYFAGAPPPAPSPRFEPSASTLTVPLAPSTTASAASASYDAGAYPVAPAPARAGAIPTPPRQNSPGSLRAERLLLESATAALMRGDSASAMATLQKHARDYPRGALAEEREVLWVKALRAHGKESAAEQRAKQFKEQFPSSLQQRAVEKPSGAK